MKFTFPFLVFFLLFVKVQGQNFYRKSTLVFKDGGTSHGFVKYDDWNQNPAVIEFKETLESKEIKKYVPSDLQSFSIDGIDYFESAFVAVSMDNVEQTETLSAMSLDTFVKKIIFLRVIEKGAVVNLYSYTDQLKMRFYVGGNKSDSITELSYKRYFTETERLNIQKGEHYKKQLLLLARQGNTFDDPELIKLLTNTAYVQRDLENVIAYINGASNRKFPLDKPSKIRFYGGAAIIAGAARVGGNHELATDATSKTGIGPKLNLGFDFMQNPITQRLFVRFNLSFDAMKYNISKIMDENGGTLKYSFSQSNFGLGAQVIYNFYNKEHIAANLGVGLAGNYSFYKNSILTSDYEVPGAIGGSYHKTDTIELHPLWLTCPVRFGLLFNRRFDCYIQGNIPVSPITNFVKYNIRAYTVQLGMNVLL